MDDYNLYIKSCSGGAIKTLFETLRDILHDVTLTFTEEGARLVTMDGSRVALIYLKLDAQNFEEYHCNGRVDAGVNISNIYKLLRSVGPNDMVCLSIKKSNTSEMEIQTFNAEKNTSTKFGLKLLDVNTENIQVPPVQFETVVTLPSTYLQRLLRDMFNLADMITVVSKTVDGKTQLVMHCTGDFATQETVISEAQECMALQQSTEDTVIEGRYSLKYLTLFCRASALSNTVEVFLKKEYPIILKYNVASLGELRFCLAPKLDDLH